MSERQTLGDRILSGTADWEAARSEGGVRAGREEWATLCGLVGLAAAAERLALACVANADASRNANRSNRRVVDYMNVYGPSHAFTQRAMDIDDRRAEESWDADRLMNEALAAFRVARPEGGG